ncbi:unnamed protein product [Victoria cruziana]
MPLPPLRLSSLLRRCSQSLCGVLMPIIIHGDLYLGAHHASLTAPMLSPSKIKSSTLTVSIALHVIGRAVAILMIGLIVSTE